MTGAGTMCAIADRANALHERARAIESNLMERVSAEARKGNYSMLYSPGKGVEKDVLEIIIGRLREHQYDVEETSYKGDYMINWSLEDHD